MIHGDVKVMAQVIDETLDDEKIEELYTMASNIESLSLLSLSAVQPWNLFDVTLQKHFFALFPESSLFPQEPEGSNNTMLIVIICCSLLGLALVLAAAVAVIIIYKKKQADLLDGMTPKEFVNQDNRPIEIFSDGEYAEQVKLDNLPIKNEAINDHKDINQMQYQNDKDDNDYQSIESILTHAEIYAQNLYKHDATVSDSYYNYIVSAGTGENYHGIDNFTFEHDATERTGTTKYSPEYKEVEVMKTPQISKSKACQNLTLTTGIETDNTVTSVSSLAGGESDTLGQCDYHAVDDCKPNNNDCNEIKIVRTVFAPKHANPTESSTCTNSTVEHEEAAIECDEATVEYATVEYDDAIEHDDAIDEYEDIEFTKGNVLEEYNDYRLSDIVIFEQ
eukprot:Awhi_evm1s13866